MSNALKAFILIGILLVVGTLILAQEPNTPEDNWCYEGGRWGDGRCGSGTEYENAWHWHCGWYMARLEAGTFQQVPTWCQPSVETAATPTASPSATIVAPTPTNTPMPLR